MLELKELKRIAENRWIIVEKSKGKKVLELGCINHTIQGIKGQRKLGIWLFDYLHKYASKATGIDIDVKGVKYLTKQGLDVQVGDAQKFNLGEKFDVIIASKLIDHLLNIEGFFSSCQRNLKKGGVLIISDDNILCFPQLIIWLLKKHLGTPDKDITIKPLPCYFKNFVGRFGFSIEEIIYNSGTGNSLKLNFFRIISKLTPKKLIFPPLFYPVYVAILKKR